MDILDQGQRWIERRLYPELERIAPHHRQRAMDRARAEYFDTIELVGILAAIAATTYLTRYGLVAPAPASRFWVAIVNFIVAFPLLVLIAGPFYVRRNRRGLQAFIEQQRNA